MPQFIKEDLPNRFLPDGNVLPAGGDATKFDGGKPTYDLFPFEVIDDISEVLKFGATKYNKSGEGRDAWNWASGKGLGKWRTLNACFRHLFAVTRGEKNDPESGLSHLAHAACCIVFLLFYQKYPEKYSQ